MDSVGILMDSVGILMHSDGQKRPGQQRARNGTATSTQPPDPPVVTRTILFNALLEPSSKTLLASTQRLDPPVVTQMSDSNGFCKDSAGF